MAESEADRIRLAIVELEKKAFGLRETADAMHEHARCYQAAARRMRQAIDGEDDDEQDGDKTQSED